MFRKHPMLARESQSGAFFCSASFCRLFFVNFYKYIENSASFPISTNFSIQTKRDLILIF